jgi:hypothetical protein
VLLVLRPYFDYAVIPSRLDGEGPPEGNQSHEKRMCVLRDVCEILRAAQDDMLMEAR